MGIYPALQSSHSDLVDGLKEGGRGVSGSVRQQRFRKILRRLASGAVGDAARRRRIVDREFYSSQSAKRRLPGTEMFGLASSLYRQRNILISGRGSVL